LFQRAYMQSLHFMTYETRMVGVERGEQAIMSKLAGRVS
jgi:hypothetical protein